MQPAPDVEDEPSEQKADAEIANTDSGCVCVSTSSAVATADGRRTSTRLIAARGRGLPDPGYLG